MPVRLTAFRASPWWPPSQGQALAAAIPATRRPRLLESFGRPTGKALERAEIFLDNAHYQLEVSRAGELVAKELRQAQNALSEIIGEFTSDDLLGRIFSTFCIGK